MKWMVAVEKQEYSELGWGASAHVLHTEGLDTDPWSVHTFSARLRDVGRRVHLVDCDLGGTALLLLLLWWHDDRLVLGPDKRQINVRCRRPDEL